MCLTDSQTHIIFWPKGPTKSIRMPKRVYTIYNRFLAQKGLLRPCDIVAAGRASKIYQNA